MASGVAIAGAEEDMVSFHYTELSAISFQPSAKHSATAGVGLAES
jgi:hypothetical protein